MTASRVLIVIPTLGERVDYLRQTLASIFDQDLPAAVVVVLPDKAEEAAAVARQSGAKVLSDPGSMTLAINAGMAQADSEVDYVNWIGDDDLLEPGALQAAVDALDRAPEAVAAYGYCRYIDPDGRSLWISKAGRIAPWLMTWGPDLVPQPGMLIRAAAWREVGGLDTRLNFALDLDLLLKLRKQGDFICVPQTLSSFRWHPDSLTVSNRTASLDESEVVKRRHATSTQAFMITCLDPLVRLATRLAAKRLNRRAANLTASQA